MTKAAEYQREWRKKHPGKASEHNKRYREKHPEKCEEQRVRQRTAYVKKGKFPYCRVSKEEQRIKHNLAAQQWRKKNPEKVKEISKRTYLKNKHTEKWKTFKRNYKGRKRAGDDKTINPRELRALLEKQQNKCAIGGEEMTDKIELDHKVPISKGGRHTLKNVQWVCRFHNRSKGNKNGLLS